MPNTESQQEEIKLMTDTATMRDRVRDIIADLSGRLAGVRN
jgi:hypothetical protein